MLNRNIGQSIPSSTRGYAGDEDENYSDNFWAPQIEEYIDFYKQIIPMVQRKLEETTGNGRIDNAVNYLERLEASVKKIVGTKFELEKYMTGEYIDTITQVLSPVSAEVRPPASAATVIPTSAASAASAAPKSVFGSWSNYVPSLLSNATSYLGNAASGTASNFANYGKHVLSTGINYGITQANLPIPQHAEGSQFERYVPPAPAEYRMSTNYTAAETPYSNLIGRDYPAGQETWDKARQDVARREDAKAAANKMSLLGGAGKRKSKRKQRRSRKQKKSRKQRR